MKTFRFILIAFVSFFYSCNKEAVDKSQELTVTIYEDTGFGTMFLNDTWQELLQFSDSEDDTVMLLSNILTEGIDIELDYERGYRYTYRAQKIEMENPPLDVSNIKYVFKELLSKEKVITQNSEEEVILFIAAEKVEFMPNYPVIYDLDGSPFVYNAYLGQIENDNNPVIMREIEGFEYETGFEYKLKVKIIIEAEPYSKRYELVQIISKE